MNNPSAHSLHVIGITGIGEIDSSTNLAETIFLAVNNQRIALKSMDILVVTQKIVSKAEGRIVNLSEFDPSAKALKLASDTGRDPQLVEAISVISYITQVQGLMPTPAYAWKCPTKIPPQIFHNTIKIAYHKNISSRRLDSHDNF